MPPNFERFPREPAGQAGNSKKEIFGGFRRRQPRLITLRTLRTLREVSFAVGDCREPDSSVCVRDSKRNYARFTRYVTAFHFFADFAAYKTVLRKEQATNGSDFWQARGSADRERRLAADQRERLLAGVRQRGSGAAPRR